jgi:FKBP-type peptidyl-prolyl cis-trans isomerase 2
MQDFKIGDTVQVKLWNGTIQATVTKIVGRAIFVDNFDDAGRALCVDVKVCVRMPSVLDIGYASRLQ